MFTRWWLIAALSIALQGCVQPPTVAYVPKVIYPQLPDLEMLPPLNLETVVFDYPRDVSRTTIKSAPECITTPANQRDADFWARCGTHPIIPNTNVMLGLDQDNVIRLQQNLEALSNRDRQWRGRLEEVNLQRRAWRESTTNSATGEAK